MDTRRIYTRKKIAMLTGLRMRRRGENRVLTLKLPLIGEKFYFPTLLGDNSFAFLLKSAEPTFLGDRRNRL
jgi:hypothetical protein